jgi:hypothetical protein
LWVTLEGAQWVMSSAHEEILREPRISSLSKTEKIT